MKLSSHMMEKTQLSHILNEKRKTTTKNSFDTYTTVKTGLKTLSSPTNSQFSSQISPKISVNHTPQPSTAFSQTKAANSGANSFLGQFSQKSHLQSILHNDKKDKHVKNFSEPYGVSTASRNADSKTSKIGSFANKLDFLSSVDQFNKLNMKSNINPQGVSKAESMLFELPSSPLFDSNKRLFTSYEPTPSNLRHKNSYLNLKTENSDLDTQSSVQKSELVSSQSTSHIDSEPAEKLKGLLTSPSNSASSRLSKTELLLNKLISPKVKTSPKLFQKTDSRTFGEGEHLLSKRNKDPLEFSIRSSERKALFLNAVTSPQNSQQSPSNFVLLSPFRQNSSLSEQLFELNRKHSIGSHEKENKLSDGTEIPKWKYERLESDGVNSHKQLTIENETEKEILQDDKLAARFHFQKESVLSNKFVNKAYSRQRIKTLNFNEIFDKLKKKIVPASTKASKDFANYKSIEFGKKFPSEIDRIKGALNDIDEGAFESNDRKLPHSTKNLHSSASKFQFEAAPRNPIRFNLGDVFLESTQESKPDRWVEDKSPQKKYQQTVFECESDENDLKLESYSRTEIEEIELAENKIREYNLLTFEGTPIKHVDEEANSERDQKNSLVEPANAQYLKEDKKFPCDELKATNENPQSQAIKDESEVKEQLLKLRDRFKLTLEAHRNREAEWRQEKLKLLERIQELEGDSKNKTGK